MTAEAFAAESPAPGAGDAVLDGLARMRAVLGDVRRAVLWSRSDELARQGVVEGFALLQQAQSAWLGLVRDLDARPDAVPRARAGCVGRTFLRDRLHRTATQAANDMKAALALAPAADPQAGGLPELAEAFAAGLVSREHVDLAVRTIGKVPREALAAPMPAGTDADRIPFGSSDVEAPADEVGHDEVGFDEVGHGEGGPGEVGPGEVGNGEDRATAAGDPADSSEPALGDGAVANGSTAAGSDASDSDTHHGAADSDDSASPASERTSPTGKADRPGLSSAPAPEPPASRSGGEAVDAYFAHVSQEYDSATTRNLSRHLMDALDPDGAESFDPDAVDKRSVSYAKDLEGMVVGRFTLDPVIGAWFIEAIEHFSSPDPAREETSADGSLVEVRDQRTASQRRADALGLMSRIALGSPEAGTTGGEPPPNRHLRRRRRLPPWSIPRRPPRKGTPSQREWLDSAAR